MISKAGIPNSAKPIRVSHLKYQKVHTVQTPEPLLTSKLSDIFSKLSHQWGPANLASYSNVTSHVQCNHLSSTSTQNLNHTSSLSKQWLTQNEPAIGKVAERSRSRENAQTKHEEIEIAKTYLETAGTRGDTFTDRKQEHLHQPLTQLKRLQPPELTETAHLILRIPTQNSTHS